MRGSLVSRGGLQLLKTPSHRQQVARRRMMAVCGMIGLALASGLIGSIGAGGREPAAPAVETGPFSYFPYQ